MSPIHVSRPTAIAVGVLFVIAVLAWGCSHSSGTAVTGPDPGTGFARLIRLEQIDASSRVSPSTLAAAVRAQERLHPALKRAHKAVVGTASTTFEGRPVVLALTSEAIPDLPRIVDGQEVVQMVVDEFRASAYYCGTSSGRTDICNAGTLGSIVTDGVRNYWLSCWHVFVRTAGKAGDVIDSPGMADAGCAPTVRVGNVSRFVPVRFDGSYNTVDCAIASIASGTAVSAIQSAGANSFKPAATPAVATIGMAVKKVGRTTGFTTGTVKAVNGNVSVAYSGIGSANFKGMIICSKMSLGGDSGSLVCTQSGNQPVGLVVSDNSTITALCPISAVFSAIGAHIAN